VTVTGRDDSSGDTSTVSFEIVMVDCSGSNIVPGSAPGDETYYIHDS
jgi:hypothetical protein